MVETITATFEGGILRPDKRLDLPAGARVQLTVELLQESTETLDKEWEDFERFCEENSVDSGGKILTRDRLHERD
jgi:predicted DNA-binding antitoxin AbrB/MazE fold protein